jgi:hypothetical protein
MAITGMEHSVAVLGRMHAQLAGLPSLLEAVPRAAFDRRLGNKWSVTEHVAHLGRYHEVFIDRVRRILAENQPDIEPYVAEADPEWPEWQRQPFEEAMQRLHAARGALVGILTGLTANQWGRTARHTRYGVLSLRGWVELFLVHEGHHLYVITRRARGLE